MLLPVDDRCVTDSLPVHFNLSFSHSDPRALDSMDQWDTAKLEEVVGKKLAKGKLPPTDIICKSVDSRRGHDIASIGTDLERT